MENTAYRAIAIVGAGAVLPDAKNVQGFWENVKNGRYSISEVAKDRWDPERYYDPNPKAPDKSYSKIGGWVRDFTWEPVKWHLAIPPRVAEVMDDAQKWAIACTHDALQDYGYPSRPLDLDRTAVILGNAMAGEKHYLTSLRVFFPEYAAELEASASFAALPVGVRREITRELHDRMGKHLPEITEDSMPGELANCIAGRIASLFNFHGPNFVTDAACASAMAALNAAAEGLIEHDFDAAITGGIDRNMGVPTFVKFCKIGALSATGTRPYAEGADGFVMGEGAAIFLMKRLADAERDQDKIYAVLRGIGGSSDGKGKGITAPNPIGQKFCIERAWQNAGLSPASATYIEGHGTSTKVGDVVEVQSLSDVLSSCHIPPGSVALGSVKSNFGHLKGAAGAAGLLKTVLALRDKVLPPSVHCEHANPDIDFAHSPLYVNTCLRPWTVPDGSTRRAGLSAFGFGGTNFHAVLEEYVPGKLNGNGKHSFAVNVSATAKENGEMVADRHVGATAVRADSGCKAPLRGALVIGANSAAQVVERLRATQKDAEAGRVPSAEAPRAADLRALERLAIDYADSKELAEKCSKALAAFGSNQPAAWKVLRAQGIFRGSGAAPKVAFLYTGQGSQYANMLSTLRKIEPIVKETFAEADRVMTPILGKPLSEFIFVDPTNEKALAKAEEDLRQTAITQPAVLAADLALTRLLQAYGITPDMTMGHSLGEYGALVAVAALPFEEALDAVSARGREMTRVAQGDNGRMAAVFAPIDEIDRLLKTVQGYVVIANINSDSQAVIGGASKAVEEACEILLNAGHNVVPLPVSHAFHTSIVAPVSEPLRRTLERLHLQLPRAPIVANVNGEFYPTGPDVVPQMLDILAKQVASPVQFVKGLRTLYSAGARVFVEVGPKKALQGFAEDVLGARGDVLSLFTNHPKNGDLASFNQALCGLYAAGLGRGTGEVAQDVAVSEVCTASAGEKSLQAVQELRELPRSGESPARVVDAQYIKLGRFFADTLERGWQIWKGKDGHATHIPVVITGAALGLPGTERVFDDTNVGRILRGEQFIDVIPTQMRQAMLDKHITRLVKSDKAGPVFESITNVADVIKLAGRSGTFNLEKEFAVSAERVAALDPVTSLAIASGIDALRDAGIPLVMRYKTTSKGTRLPDRWGLPEALRDDTGVIFASVFPGYDSFADEMSRYYADHERREQLAMLEDLLARVSDVNGHSTLIAEIKSRITSLRAAIEKEPYVFERRFLFKTLSMGHSQFAEFIGARGPNTQINAACASTTQAVSLAEDWIHTGRCRRVIIISADDITSDHLIEWFGAGFLASGAAATDDVVEEAAIPFDRRRHGMIMGMGAAALVVESAEAANERGLRPICEVLSATTANSAFHGTRLDVQHIAKVMEELIASAEAHHNIARHEMAPQTVFVSHETYTPARGGSASAEIHALRQVFGDAADRIVITNTKGLTGHAMGTGIEDVVAVKALETGWVPPVVNFKEVDPELGALNLSKGGVYPVDYALRLGAGFGSQISMTLFRRTGRRDGVRCNPDSLGYRTRVDDEHAWATWLARVTEQSAPQVEVVCHTLRILDKATAARTEMAPVEPEKSVTAVPNPVGPTPQETAPFTKVISLPESASTEPTGAAPANSPLPAATSTKLETAADSVKEQVLRLVSAKTGYPADMLDLDLDLEADLGVDTVKQAEVFAAIRELYGIQRDENLKLRDFPTLAQVIQFVHTKRPDLVAEGADFNGNLKIQEPQPQAGAVVPEPVAKQSSAVEDVKDRVLDLVVEKTGYPREMLDLDLDLEADLGIDTVKQAEMFAAIREMYKITRDENRKLRDYPTLAHVIRFVNERRRDLAAAPASAPATIAPSVVTQPHPAAAPQAAAPLPAPSETRVAVDSSIQDKVLDIVAQKTGYPKDMLDLDLDLEADLGIDTVKQAEMFASVRATFNIPRDENLKLRDFPTLARVIQFAEERVLRQAAPVATTTEPPPAPVQKETPALKTSAESAASAPLRSTLTRPVPLPFDEADKVPRRVPIPDLRPPLDMCKTTGVVLGFSQRVVVMPDNGGVGNALSQQLRARGVTVLTIDRDWPDETLLAELKHWTSQGAIHGVYWLPALDVEAKFTAMDLAVWREALRVRVKLLYRAMQTLYTQIAEPGTFLLTASRLGGQHGYDDHGAVAPLGGAVVGFAKTYKRERNGALVKAVDFGVDSHAPEIAELLIAETMRDPGAVEIGYKMGLRWTVGLTEKSADDGPAAMSLNSGSVFLITGAAGSIVSAITADFAAASGGTFYLLDLVPERPADDPDLKKFAENKEALKRELFARIKARGERATPALVERDLALIERAVAARHAIDSVEAAGGTARYFAVDLTKPDAVAEVIRQVRERSGHIDVLLHAAGIERSHSLPDKDPHEFDLVFDVKTDGWFNLFHAIGDMPVGASVVFSSIAGRFGNAGQADYSAANDLLCKLTSHLQTARTATRAIAVDWTAWSGIGMATRGSIPKMMDLAGIDMLPPEAGIPLIRRELTAGCTRGEIVIANRLGVLLNAWDVDGGLNRDISRTFAGKRAGQGPMIGTLTSVDLYRGLTVETTLDPKIQPFLFDHQIDGTPVLPGVMGVEAFAETALCMLPGWHVAAVEDVNFLAPFKFYRNEPRTLSIRAVFHPENDQVIADCELLGSRTLANQVQPQVTVHFQGRVRLTSKQLDNVQSVPPPGAPAEQLMGSSDVYRIYFHGPAYQVLQQAWRDGDRLVGRMKADLPANHVPSEKPTSLEPRLIELCFQTAGLWELVTLGKLGLPQKMEAVTSLRKPGPGRVLYSVVTPKNDRKAFDAEVVDTEGNRYLQLRGYSTVTLSKSTDTEPLKALHAVAH